MRIFPEIPNKPHIVQFSLDVFMDIRFAMLDWLEAEVEVHPSINVDGPIEDIWPDKWHFQTDFATRIMQFHFAELYHAMLFKLTWIGHVLDSDRKIQSREGTAAISDK